MRKWYPWVLVGLALGFSAAVFGRLPERVPIHWDAAGVADGFSSRIVAVVLAPAIMAVVAILLPWLPKLDPKRENYEKFQPTYDLVVNMVVTMMGVMHVGMLGAALGWPIAMERFTPLLVGALFILLGNVMPRARPNWLFGIRTPWTLTSDRVWERTHRLGGYLFVGGGVVVMLLAFAPPAIVPPIMIATITIAAGVPLVFSYVAWKQEREARPQ
jgi:uncharacterized membrane protein